MQGEVRKNVGGVEMCERMSGEVCWGVGGGEGSCGKSCGGRCREVC